VVGERVGQEHDDAGDGHAVAHGVVERVDSDLDARERCEP
jgi:hypothetical protein